MNILTSYPIQESHVVVSEWEELIKGITRICTITSIASTRGEVVTEPHLWIHR